MLECSLEVAVLHTCCFRLLSVSQDCTPCPASFHFVSVHWVFPSLSTSLLQICVGAKDSIPDPFQSCYEKLPHSLFFSPISVKWQCKKALCNQG